VRREVPTRGHVLPHWLLELHRAEAEGRALVAADPARARSELLAGDVIPGSQHVTVVVSIDHSLAAVTDGFASPLPLAELESSVRGADELQGVTFTEVTVADARARLDGGLAGEQLLNPPFESDEWPSTRPLVEWVARRLA
jgi:hypothetical protein